MHIFQDINDLMLMFRSVKCNYRKKTNKKLFLCKCSKKNKTKSRPIGPYLSLCFKVTPLGEM